MLGSLENRLRRRTSGAFIAEIDGLRFLAIAPVLVHHLAERIYRRMDRQGTLTDGAEMIVELLPSGRLGVEIFFVISGFVIAMPMMKNWLHKDSTAFDYGRYFRRRLTRLEPPYLLVMLTLFLGVVVAQNFAGDVFGALASGTRSFSNEGVSLFDSFAASMLYLHGILLHSSPRLNPPAWSLEIEFQFYIIAPLLLLGTFSLIRRREYLLLPALMVCVGAIKALATMAAPAAVQPYLVSAFIEYFALGFVVCYLYLKGIFEQPFFVRFSGPVWIAGLLAAFYADFFRDAPGVVGEAHYYLKVAGILAIFLGSFGGGVGCRFVSTTWVNLIGGMCYSIYLLHLFIFQVGVVVFSRVFFSEDFVLNFVVYSLTLIPVALGASAVFFVLVEKPCMNPRWVSDLRARLGGSRG